MNLPKKVSAFIFINFIVSLFVLFFLGTEWTIRDWKELLFWAALAVISESLGITLPSGIGVSVGFAVNLASIIIGGPFMAALVSICGFTLRILKFQGGKYTHLFNTPYYKTLFNASQGVMVTGVSAVAYVAAGGTVGKFSLIPTLVALIMHILLNSVIMVRLMSFLSNQSFISMWTNNIRGVLPSSIAVGTLGIIIALAYISYGPIAVLLFFGPLLLARYSFKLYVNMRNIYMDTIKALNKTMEAKDAYTSGHASRVQEYAVKLATAMNLSEDKIQNIKTAAILHDIGKIGIDDNILRKPSALTQNEYEDIKRHPVIGSEILKDVDFLKEVSTIIRYHHERYDGKGYPLGLKGDEIPLEAAILAIADVYDAMTSNRPYRNSLGKETALDEIRINAGTQFNPELANMFITIMSA